MRSFKGKKTLPGRSAAIAVSIAQGATRTSKVGHFLLRQGQEGFKNLPAQHNCLFSTLPARPPISDDDPLRRIASFFKASGSIPAEPESQNMYFERKELISRRVYLASCRAVIVRSLREKLRVTDVNAL